MTTGTRVGILLSLALAVITALGGIAYVCTNRLLAATSAVAHASNVQFQLQRIVDQHVDAETGQRGFILTGDRKYLEPYDAAVHQIHQQIDDVSKLVQGDPAQQESLVRIRNLSESKLDELRQTIDLRNETGLEAATAVVRTDRGKATMDALRNVVAEMQARERASLEASQQASRSDANQLVLALAVWTPLSLAVLGILSLFVLRRMHFAEAKSPSIRAGKPWTRVASRYGLAVVAVAVATLLRIWLVRSLGPMPLFITFYPAVLAVASLAGGGPGIVTALVSAVVADFFFINPTFSFAVAAPNDIVALGIFTGANLFMCLLAERLQRARRAEAVAAEQELMAVTLASIGDGVIVCGTDGKVTFLNGEAERLTGWSGALAAGRPITEVFRIINEHTRKPVENPVEKVLRLKSIVGLANHTVLISRDGREIPIDDSGAPIRQGSGEVRGVVLVFRDFSTQKQAHTSHARLATIVESSDDAIISKDLSGAVLTWNSGAQRLFGYTASEMVGRPVHTLLPHDRTNEEDDILARLRRGERIEHFETTRIAKDGKCIDVSVTLSPLRDDADNIVGISSIFRDISDRKRAEEGLKAAKISADRAKADAESANRAKDHFLAVLSHELRTPLKPVLTTANLMLAENALPNRFHEDVDLIRRNVELEARLIDDLLDVTRITRGKLELDRKAVELCQVIRRAVEVCQPDIAARRLEFGVDSGAGSYVVYADPARLQQVFWNLIKNAIKFTPGGGCVGIRCRTEDGHVITEVNDSGLGIEASVLPQIFNAFEQGERRITRQFGGLGLGLAISKAIVEMHGGSITASSPGPGKGATFCVRLPLARRPLGGNVRDPNGQMPAASSRPLHILLVEDHGDTAHILGRLLRQFGHHVSLAGDVASGTEAVMRERFDLVISDLGLPDGSGADLLRALRAAGHTVPAIALSGYGQDEDVRRSLESGFATHLVKPPSPARLAQAIAQVSGSIGTGAQAPASEATAR